MKRTIALGSGNSYLDIGFQPPLDEERQQVVLDYIERSGLPGIVAPFPPPAFEENDYTISHNVLSFNTADSHRASPERFKLEAEYLSNLAANALRLVGEEVAVLQGIVQVDFGHFVFGSQADASRVRQKKFGTL